MTPEQAQQLLQIWVQLLDPTGPGWPQLGNRTLVDALGIVLTQLVGEIRPGSRAGRKRAVAPTPTSSRRSPRRSKSPAPSTPRPRDRAVDSSCVGVQLEALRILMAKISVSPFWIPALG
jgi:hypothetical protein